MTGSRAFRVFAVSRFRDLLAAPRITRVRGPIRQNRMLLQEEGVAASSLRPSCKEYIPKNWRKLLLR
jgi:hypothetical protein